MRGRSRRLSLVCLCLLWCAVRLEASGGSSCRHSSSMTLVAHVRSLHLLVMWWIDGHGCLLRELRLLVNDGRDLVVAGVRMLGLVV